MSPLAQKKQIRLLASIARKSRHEKYYIAIIFATVLILDGPPACIFDAKHLLKVDSNWWKLDTDYIHTTEQDREPSHAFGRFSKQSQFQFYFLSYLFVTFIAKNNGLCILGKIIFSEAYMC